MSIKDKVLAFFKEEEGLTTVEYAVAGGVVAAGVVAIFIALRDEIIVQIQAIITALQTG